MDTGQSIRAGETGSLRLSALCSAMVVTAGCSKSRERLGHDLLTLENSHYFFFFFWNSCMVFLLGFSGDFDKWGFSTDFSGEGELVNWKPFAMPVSVNASTNPPVLNGVNVTLITLLLPVGCADPGSSWLGEHSGGHDSNKMPMEIAWVGHGSRMQSCLGDCEMHLSPFWTNQWVQVHWQSTWGCSVAQVLPTKRLILKR